jgi:hypothetical protein
VFKFVCGDILDLCHPCQIAIGTLCTCTIILLGYIWVVEVNLAPTWRSQSGNLAECPTWPNLGTPNLANVATLLGSTLSVLEPIWRHWQSNLAVWLPKSMGTGLGAGGASLAKCSIWQSFQHSLSGQSGELPNLANWAYS